MTDTTRKRLYIALALIAVAIVLAWAFSVALEITLVKAVAWVVICLFVVIVAGMLLGVA